MAKDYREITVTIVDGEEIAHVWTNIPKYRNRLLKLGATPKPSDESGNFLEAPATLFWPRKRRLGIPPTGRPFSVSKPRG